jgi:protein SDA1
VRSPGYGVKSTLLIDRRTDAKTVSIAARATFHPNTKVQSAALHFFLGSETDADAEDSSDSEGEIKDARKDVRKMEHSLHVGKTRRKGEKALQLMKKEENKVRLPKVLCSSETDNWQRRRVKVAGLGSTPNFPALELLNDPQTFGEKLFDNLHKHGVLSCNTLPSND